MKKNILLLCNGLSGSGKTYFITNQLGNLFYNLRSLTTRPPRPGETNGEKYFFVPEWQFNTYDLATRLFVNQAYWQPGKPKWLYGVPEFEIKAHLGQNMVYDVIQPMYSRQLIDWFNKNGLGKYYDCRVAWFLPPENNYDIARSRANMPDDNRVRVNNTCDAIDFLRAGLEIDFIVKSSADETIIPARLDKLIKRLHAQKSR